MAVFPLRACFAGESDTSSPLSIVSKRECSFFHITTHFSVIGWGCGSCVASWERVALGESCNTGLTLSSVLRVSLRGGSCSFSSSGFGLVISFWTSVWLTPFEASKPTSLSSFQRLLPTIKLSLAMSSLLNSVMPFTPSFVPSPLLLLSISKSKERVEKSGEVTRRCRGLLGVSSRPDWLVVNRGCRAVGDLHSALPEPVDPSRLKANPKSIFDEEGDNIGLPQPVDERLFEGTADERFDIMLPRGVSTLVNRGDRMAPSVAR